MTDLNDIELLEAYARQRSEEAFRELVRRHVDFVYSAAMRHLRSPDLSQEATQSAFIALAKKAGHLRGETVIAGWLHRAAIFAAQKLRRSEARRKHWEREAAAMNVPEESPQDFEELALPHVDRALAELGEPDRNAIILRFIQRKALGEVAQIMGTSEDAAKKRVSRALEKLRALLARRGVAVSAGALAAGLSQMPTTAAPTALPAALAALAVKTGASTLLALTASVPAKLAAVAGLIVVGGSTFLLWHNRPGTPAAAPTATVQATSMKIKLASVMVNDQDKALAFYTGVLGFVKKTDQPVPGGRWLTVVSPADPAGIELLLEPTAFAPAKIYQAALFEAGIPMTALMVEDLPAKHQAMTKAGVVFSMDPTAAGPVTISVFEDTCGNRIQLLQPPGVSRSATPLAPRIKLSSVMVDDQEKALKFYTEVLGFVKKQDMPVGESRWLTVVSPDEREGAELVLEPMGFSPARTYQKALFDAGIPLTSLAVEDLPQTHQRLKKLGVVFTRPPTQAGRVVMAVMQDTCGNLIQLAQKQP